MRATTHWSGKREELVRTQEKKGGRSPHSLEHAEFGAGQGAGKSEPVGTHQGERGRREEDASGGVAGGWGSSNGYGSGSEGKTEEDITDQITE